MRACAATAVARAAARGAGLAAAAAHRPLACAGMPAYGLCAGSLCMAHAVWYCTCQDLHASQLACASSLPPSSSHHAHTPGPGPCAGNGAEAKYKVAPEHVARVYEEVVMPLTKEVEVLYLLKRLG